MISVLGSTISMAWFVKSSKSKTDQYEEQRKIQQLSGLDMLKQLKILLPQVEWWSNRGSATLVGAWNKFCHGNGVGRTVEQLSFQLEKDGCKRFTRMLGCWRNQRRLEGFGVFAQKMQYGQNANWENEMYSVCLQLLGLLQLTENSIYTICLSNANHVLTKLCLNEANC